MSCQTNKVIAMKEVVPWPLTSETSLDPHKFDVRCYILIVSYSPLVVYYNAGYIQQSPFSIASKHKLSHLSNPHVVDSGPDAIKDYRRFLRPLSALSGMSVRRCEASFPAGSGMQPLGFPG